MLLRGSICRSQRETGRSGLMLACKHVVYIIFFFLLLFMGLDGRRFWHKRKGGITHYAHMFALRDCWDRHDLMVVFVLLCIITA